MTDSSSSSKPLTDSTADISEEISEELSEPLTELAVGPWWWVLIRGILAIAFGVIAVFSPANALWAIVIVFGAYAIVDGITEIAHAIHVRKSMKRWGILLFAGIVSVLAGVAALILPAFAALFGALFLIWTIVFYNVTHGAMVIGSASGAQAKGKGWAIFAGVASIVFGVILAILTFVAPDAAVAGLVLAIGIYAVAFGVMLAIAAIAARASGRKTVTVDTV